jgi:hypothetical protein
MPDPGLKPGLKPWANLSNRFAVKSDDSQVFWFFNPHLLFIICYLSFFP